MNPAPHASRDQRLSALRFWLWWLALTLLALALLGTAIKRLADRHRLASAEQGAVELSLTLARMLPDAEVLFLGQPPKASSLAALGALQQANRLLQFRLFDAAGRERLGLQAQSQIAWNEAPATAGSTLAQDVAQRRRPHTELARGDGLARPEFSTRAWVPVQWADHVVGVFEIEFDSSSNARTTAASFKTATWIAGAALLLTMTAAALLLRHRAGRELSAEDRARFLAEHDGLTGALNHSHFSRMLAQACRRVHRNPGRSLAVLCVDLDGFGEINERLGSATGDMLLRETAQRLQGVLRDGDWLARLAGDRFAIVQQGAGDAQAVEALVRHVLARLAQPHALASEPEGLVLTACAGAALHGVDGEHADTLLGHAQAALARAKSSGRGAWGFYDPTLDKALQDKRALAHELQSTLQRGSLQLHFQPLYTAAGVLKGYEALARWPHPLRGFIPPLVFIALAEETGQIEALGRWALNAACQEAAGWSQPLSVAVNLSAAQFHQGQDIVREVHDALHRSGLAPQRLELEITESLLMHHTEQVLATLHALRTLGVRIAMDDFGTGFSSLAYLWRFPFDKLKIDRAFTQGLGSDARVDAIVHSIVTMAHSLAMQVNAEGVETELQRDALCRHGCDELQGYLLGRPMPSELLAHREAESVGTLDSLTGSLKVTRPAALDLNLG